MIPKAKHLLLDHMERKWCGSYNNLVVLQPSDFWRKVAGFTKEGSKLYMRQHDKFEEHVSGSMRSRTCILIPFKSFES